MSSANVSIADYLARAFQVAYRAGQAIAFPIGGLLTHPARHYGFFESEFWQKHPFVLPCMVAAAVALISTLINALLLPEVRLFRVKQFDFCLHFVDLEGTKKERGCIEIDYATAHPKDNIPVGDLAPCQHLCNVLDVRSHSCCVSRVQ